MRAFEIWNEPNLAPFFRGTKAEYFVPDGQFDATPPNTNWCSPRRIWTR